MKIHILTQDSDSKEQLFALLGKMDLTCTLHEAVEPLLRAVKKLKKSDVVFYDLALENRLWALERLYTSTRRTNLVGFELLTKETAQGGQHCVDGMEHYLLLPKNQDRAKARMQEVFKAVARAAAPKKRKPKSSPKPVSKVDASSSHHEPIAVQRVESTGSSRFDARYLQAQSETMQSFLDRMYQSVGSNVLMLVNGEDGAEFELVAREFNYHANGDACPLLVTDPMQLDFDEFRRFEKNAASLGEVHNCFVDMSIELTRSSTRALLECMDHLRALANSHLRLIVGYVNDSESYFCEESEVMLAHLRKHATSLEIPDFSERAADIPFIAQRVFSTLRTAHPFLKARILSMEAIQFLQTECQQFDYARLVRVMRNAMALGASETLTRKELENLSDNSPITQHLIESLADEKFFDSEASGAA
ncbi:MAG: hypothetical protein ACNA77_09735 [Opitutales bacterium]